jgi:predicted  nucleic acid-binding Zn-ribbon protein
MDLEAERAVTVTDLRHFESELSEYKQSSKRFSEALQKANSEQAKKGKELLKVEAELRDARVRMSSLDREVGEARRRAGELESWREQHECGAYVYLNLWDLWNELTCA